MSVELAGLTGEDVKAEINNDILIIRGERKFEEEESEGGRRRTGADPRGV